MNWLRTIWNLTGFPLTDKADLSPAKVTPPSGYNWHLMLACDPPFSAPGGVVLAFWRPGWERVAFHKREELSLALNAHGLYWAYLPDGIEIDGEYTPASPPKQLPTT